MIEDIFEVDDPQRITTQLQKNCELQGDFTFEKDGKTVKIAKKALHSNIIGRHESATCSIT